MTGIDPAALTSLEAVEAGAVVLRAGFERWGVHGHGLDTTRAILNAAVAAALAAQGSGGDDTGEVPFAVTDRGFRRYEPIPTGYGHVVSVYESSAATEPCVWLEIDAKGATVGPDGDLAAHMRDQDAETLIRTLRQALDGHYQRRTGPAASTQEGRG